MRQCAGTALDLWQLERRPQPAPVEKPPYLYARTEMPVVDVHMHIYPRHDPDNDLLRITASYLEVMDQSGVQVSVNLSGSPEAVACSGQLHAAGHGRVLLCPGTYFKNDTADFWWSEEDLLRFKQDPGIAGLKIWCKYEQPLQRQQIQKKLKRQNELGIPAIGMHIADPPARGFWQPNYWECISDAERVIREHPQINFIMAHGFWLMTDDEGLDVLATYFDCYPNLHVDLSAVFQWWDGPEPTRDKLRDFLIAYKDRVLYGTDGNPMYSRAEHFDRTFSILETRGRNLPGFFGEPDRKWSIFGLDLPNEVLNYIYYWNAARLIPEIRERLRSSGYKV